MEKMTKKERVWAAMNFQETDRVPVYDLLFNDACIEYFAKDYPTPDEEGIKTKCRAISRMLDMTRGAEVGPRIPGNYIDEDGFDNLFDRWDSLGHKSRPFNDEDGAIEWLKRTIANMENRNRTADIGAIAKQKRERFLEIQSYIGDDTVVLLNQSGTGLDDIRYKLGFDYFSYISVDEPELISQYLQLHTDFELRLIHEYADRKLSICTLTYGDIAMKHSLLHSPEWLRAEFFPRLKLMNEAYHQHDIKCLFHSDGNIMPILDDLIETGIDGLNPIETMAGMDVGTLYEKCKGRVFLTGGIDMSQLLSNGTAQEVEKVCRSAISDAPRGYFIGSTTELNNSAQLENILMMLKVAGLAI